MSTGVEPGLSSPFALRGTVLRNRTVVSAMTQYSAEDGFANDYHLVHLGRFALGGFGAVITESAAVSRGGRSSWGDLGIWSDDHIAPLARVANFLIAHGCVPGIQLSHAAGRAGQIRPWLRPGAERYDDPDDPPWPWAIRSASEMSSDEIDAMVEDFATAAQRAVRAGFRLIEIHMAHAYGLNSFLSPLTNHRTDAFGGDAARRMVVPLEVARRVRAVVPEDIPMQSKVSAIETVEGGITFAETLQLARSLKLIGLDLIDVSTTTLPNDPVDYGYQVDWAARIRHEVGIPTMTVGLILSAEHADAIVRAEQADLIAVGRQALDDPNWAVHADLALHGSYTRAWPKQVGLWLAKRHDVLTRLGPWRSGRWPSRPGPVARTERMGTPCTEHG